MSEMCGGGKKWEGCKFLPSTCREINYEQHGVQEAGEGLLNHLPTTSSKHEI